MGKKRELTTRPANGGPPANGNAGAIAPAYPTAPEIGRTGYAMEPGRPETWPPMAEFRPRYEERFARDGYRIAEYVMALMEYEVVSGQPRDGRVSTRAFFGHRAESLAEAVNYWRLFWAFDGPLYQRYVVEFEALPGCAAWRAEARTMRFIPEHVRRENVDAYWAAP